MVRRQAGHGVRRPPLSIGWEVVPRLTILVGMRKRGGRMPRRWSGRSVRATDPAPTGTDASITGASTVPTVPPHASVLVSPWLPPVPATRGRPANRRLPTVGAT